MLADVFLEKGKPTYNTRLRIDHTYPYQKSYVFSLYTLFGDLIDMEPVIVVRKADSRTGKIYKSVYVRTLRFPCLNEYHSLFYKEQKKVIPLNIQDLLTPRGLAHLIMGDGFLYQGIVMLCTESFTCFFFYLYNKKKAGGTRTSNKCIAWKLWNKSYFE